MADPTPVTLQSLAPWGSALPDPQRLLTADELLHDPQYDSGVELVEGKLVSMSPTGGLHGLLSGRLNRIVGNYVEQYQLGEVLGAETGFLLARNPDTVLAPDIAFVRAGRAVNTPGFLPFAPDLVIEIASPSQYRPELATKAQQFLAAGTLLLWVVWPENEQIDVWQPGQSVQTLGLTDSLDGYSILPGFSLLIRRLFS